MNNITSKAVLPGQRGSILLEGMIAILIFSLGILGLMGMQAASIKNVSDAKYRLDASYLANQIVGQMWADAPTNLASYASTNSYKSSWQATIASTLPSGAGNILVSAAQQVTVTITWQVPGESAHSYVMVAYIKALGAA